MRINSNSFRYGLTNRFTGRFPGKSGAKWLLKLPSHLASVATLPCETLMPEKAINDKLRNSAATYLRCGGDSNNRINEGLLLSLSATAVI